MELWIALVVRVWNDVRVEDDRRPSAVYGDVDQSYGPVIIPRAVMTRNERNVCELTSVSHTNQTSFDQTIKMVQNLFVETSNS